ncbi:FLAP endonuclease [Blastocystis sp. subtype 4]|uniref:FLAP endonuclease n=1 Tax=Blastocystis sp. subtype 4 TaxID=944170 RepID=UPI0007121D95|nr:FLAP endonuclease [Blastocystis sp. subtype 4]KNB43819.1 FLAP endonuclease [Blastocystis sp. subtype 4]|eukprot:XP_014527262.1 FLAP endonuclease [Blastocystis sp. subtype 4]
MGIKGLSKLISTYAPRAMKEVDPKKYTGRLIAIDASVMIYQYLVAIRTNSSMSSLMLTNSEGDVTSHIQGVLSKTIKMMEDGLKPVFVFEGKPPEMKRGEVILDKRKANREKAEEELKTAQETGNEEDIEKLSKRVVHMDSSHIDDCKTLLKLMGIPVVDAASEAESQCAELVKKKVVWGMASEDMDSLTFGAPYLLRHLTKSQGGKKDQSGVIEVDLAAVLEDMKLTQEEFVDMCILCGCDYCDTIRGIGQVKAYQFIQKYHTIEKVLENLPDKYSVPPNWPYQEARRLFTSPEVTDAQNVTIKFTSIDKDGLRSFLVNDKGFNPDRVNSYIERLEKAKDKCKQRRMDSFFTVKSTSSSQKRSPPPVTKKSKSSKKCILC